jgi:hypothetical protein
MVSRNAAAALHLGLAALLSFTICTLPGPASASSASPTSAAQERAATAERFVEKALRIWQERLNLNEWDIRVNLVRPNVLEPNTLGNIHWDTSTRRATIDILSSYDYTLPLPKMLNDMEFTIVHELVHLQLASLPRSKATERQEEYAVNQLAYALLNLSRH